MMNKLLIKFAKNKKSYMLFIILQCIFNSVFIIINSYLLALIIESIFIKSKNILSIKGYVTYFLLNALIKALLNFILDSLLKNLSEAIKENIKQDTFSLLINSNAYNVKQQGTGKLINILTEGSDTLTAYYSQYLPQFFSSVITPVIICIFVASKDLISALIMLITYPLIPIFMALIGYKSKEKNQQQWETLTSLSSHFLDMLRGLRTLKAFGRSKLQEEKVYEISENYRKSTLDVLKISFLSALVLETSATISTAIVAVNLGLRLVYNKIDFLTAFFVLVITPEFYIPLRQLGAKFHASLNGKVAIDKIEKLESSLSEALNKTGEAFIDKIPLTIEIKQLNFYHQQQEALHNLSLKIAPKETVAIIGESGSGKSTLINIIAGLLSPENTAVFINGKDINSINADEYMSKIALVPQFPHIFNMSLRENIVLGSSISEEEFLNICKLTRIDSFSHKFRKGYNTVIGDGEDTDLSGGEKQRIALARALAKNPQLIILDEPSSALDSHTEELLTELFNGVLKDKTIVLAAHRLNTVKAADKIFILEKGQLVEHGSPKELLLKKGKYYSLISLASGGDL